MATPGPVEESEEAMDTMEQGGGSREEDKEGGGESGGSEEELEGEAVKDKDQEQETDQVNLSCLC